MSLQVWLPLNGDLHNQGLQNVNVTNNGATVDNNGKIGKCYSFGNNTYLSASGVLINANCWTLSAWFYARSVSSSSNNYMVGWGASNSGVFSGCLCSYNGKISTRVSSTSYSSGVTTPIETWTHFVASYDGSTLKQYINGVLIKTTTNVSASSQYNNMYIGARNTGAGSFDGKLNDVRMYNHILSDKEVEELAKGLVLWYQLDGRNDSQLPLGYQQLEYLEGTGTQYIDTNRVPLDTDEFKFKYSLQTIDAYKGPFGAYSAEAANTVRIIPNNGSATKILLYFNSKATGGLLEITNLTTAAEQIVEGRLSKTAYSLKNLTIGTTAQASNATDLFTTKGTILVGTMKLFGQSSGYLSNSRIYYFGVYNNGICKQYFIPAKRLSDNTLGMYDIISKTFFTNAGTGTFIAGPVINTPTIIYDSSGYNNNGIIYGNLQMVKGSPKYNYSTQFSGNTNYIEAASLPATTSTICAWVKFNTIPNSGYSMILHDKVSQLAIGHSFTSNHLIAYIGSESIGSWITFQPTENTWYHIAVVKTGATTRNIYINGEQVTATDTSYWSGDLDTFMVGGRHTNGQYQDFFNGKMSDVRAYVTALTTTQIQELYNTSMSVDSNGNSIPRGL